jgi:S1-C subfamily serine protease
MSEQNYALSSFSDDLAAAVQRAGASIVLVNARHRIPASGIAYAADLILTANHVVERDEEISVVLEDGREIAVTLAGRDPGSDLAILRLTEAAAQTAEVEAQEARVGQIVLALGRPGLGGVEASIGVVSAIGGPARTGRGGLLERYLRTDTTPFPGFSGGPLINAGGKVLGLNTSGFGHGAAVTIPAGLAWRTAEVLATHGQIKRGYLGVRSQPVRISPAQQQVLGRQQATGLLLVSVEDGSPAEQGGLLVGDILVGIGEQSVSDPDELTASLVGAVVGQPTTVQLLRAGQPLSVTVTIGERS